MLAITMEQFTEHQAAELLGVSPSEIRRARIGLGVVLTPPQHMSEKEVHEVKRWLAKAPPPDKHVDEAASEWDVSSAAVRNALSHVLNEISDYVPREREDKIRKYAVTHKWER